MFGKLNIGLKLNVMLVLIFSTLVVVAILLSGGSVRQLILQTSQHRLQQEMESLHLSLAQIERDLQVGAQLYAAAPDLARAVAVGAEADARAAIVHYQESVYDEPSEYVEVLDADGQPLVAIGSGGEDIGWPAGEALPNDTSSSRASRTALLMSQDGRRSQLWLAAALPIHDSADQLVGWLRVSRRLDSEFLNALNGARQDVYLVVIRQGQIVAHNIPLAADQLLLNTSDLPVEARGLRSGVVFDAAGQPVVIYQGQRVLIYEGRVVNPGDSLLRDELDEALVFLVEPEGIARAAAGQTVIGQELVYGVSGTSPTLVGYTPLGLGGDEQAVLAVLIRQDDLYAFQRELVNNTTRAFALLALIALGAVDLFVFTRIAAPIRDLQQAARQMAGGDYAQRAAATSKDEVGRLAASFNEMADTVQRREADLQQLTNSLEEQVSQRTQQLVASNAQLEREIGERRRVEEEIRQLNEDLERRVSERTRELEAANQHLTALTRIKDDFISNVSHELRTPITSIKLFHTLLESKPADSSKYMLHLKRETDRLAHIIEDLLMLSRLDRDRIVLSPSSVDLNELARQYVEDRAPLAESRGLSLACELTSPLPAVRADAGLVGQVLSIILTNALSYTPQGGRITIRTHAQHLNGQRWAGFSISDTGPGIPPHEQEQLFKRFWRGQISHALKTPGVGLGLSIAREIVERHQGRIEVESAGLPGQGATFSVWLSAQASGA